MTTKTNQIIVPLHRSNGVDCYGHSWNATPDFLKGRCEYLIVAKYDDPDVGQLSETRALSFPEGLPVPAILAELQNAVENWIYAQAGDNADGYAVIHTDDRVDPREEVTVELFR